MGRTVVKCVPCPNICEGPLSVLGSLSPYTATSQHANDRLPVSCIPVLASCGPAYQHHVSQLVSLANKEYQDFLQSEDGFGFSGQVGVAPASLVPPYPVPAAGVPAGGQRGLAAGV